MGVLADIQAALDTRLSTLSGSPAVAWENVNYRPTNGTSWIRPTHSPADTVLYTISGTKHYKGMYIIDVFTPPEKGPGAALTILDSIQSHFVPTTSLVAGSTTVYIQQVSRRQSRREESWYMSSIAINYICYA